MQENRTRDPIAWNPTRRATTRRRGRTAENAELDLVYDEQADAMIVSEECPLGEEARRYALSKYPKISKQAAKGQ